MLGVELRDISASKVIDQVRDEPVLRFQLVYSQQIV